MHTCEQSMTKNLQITGVERVARENSFIAKEECAKNLVCIFYGSISKEGRDDLGKKWGGEGCGIRVITYYHQFVGRDDVIEKRKRNIHLGKKAI